MKLAAIALVPTCLLLFPSPAISGELTGKVTLTKRIASVTNVVVFVSSPTVPRSPAAEEPMTMTITGRHLRPQIVVAQSGQTVTVTNAGPYHYNINFTSKQKGVSNHAFMVGTHVSLRFDKPEMFIRLRNDHLSSLYGWVCVMEHAFHAVPDVDGTFKISGLPPGKHTIVAAHPNGHVGQVSREITVTEDATTTVELTLPDAL